MRQRPPAKQQQQQHGRCRRCCAGCAKLTLAALALGALFVGYMVLVAAPAAPQLHPVRRVALADLTYADFYENHVVTRTPVIITGGAARGWIPSHWTLETFAARCPASTVHFSHFYAETWFLLPAPLRYWADLLARALIGRSVAAQMDVLRTPVTMRDYVDYVEGLEAAYQADPGGADPAKPVMPFDTGLFLLDTALRYPFLPRYIHEPGLPDVCPAMLAEVNVPGWIADNTLYHLPTVSRHLYNITWELPKLFVGPRGGSAYPMHRDRCDGDNWQTLVRGHKRFAIFPDGPAGTTAGSAEATDASLYRVTELGGKDVFFKVNAMAPVMWAYPAFAAFDVGRQAAAAAAAAAAGQPPPAAARGFAGELHGGEILYMPRGSAHQFENLSPVLSYVMRFIGRKELPYLFGELFGRTGVYLFDPDYSPAKIREHMTGKMRRWYEALDADTKRERDYAFGEYVDAMDLKNQNPEDEMDGMSPDPVLHHEGKQVLGTGAFAHKEL